MSHALEADVSESIGAPLLVRRPATQEKQNNVARKVYRRCAG
jgi:hypothetical protein